MTLVAALARASALGVLDLGHDEKVARDALDLLVRRRVGVFGVRLPEHSSPNMLGLNLPVEARVVVLPASMLEIASAWPSRALLVQVRTVEEARAAAAAGAHGLIVKGHESGGIVGEETSFILLQRVLAETALPVWVQGGIGLHTAPACIAAGARGVVLDSQLALLDDAETSGELRRALSAFDGSETIVAGGYRLYARPNARAPEPEDGPAQIAKKLGAGDPSKHLVTLGQDAAFAAPFAKRFGTVERLVRALHTSFEGHVRQARAQTPLARFSSFAETYGTRFPIAQGPMTRVSDRAEFAEHVARGGGLPFLALSLMRGAEARKLVLETKERLGDMPWGVGILGFLPPDVREEQLALLTEVKPPVVLIAGGRPSQAKPLEQVGIKTFLHVPSPGLLDLFIKEGARRFVFEGRECGGHVGPRSSFVLWETAVERLLACERLNEVSVLFAGGIHDACSAKMVATLAAPLAARGAKVGVLMGTAYLFTQEAVQGGAIGEVFQQAAIACDRTVLLETAPGHATRCAESDYVTMFEAERQRLTAEGNDAQATWAALENLNVGRLRLASKGLVRQGDAIVEVSSKDQAREGMFMIGQVATLRSARCTIEELHSDVCDRSTKELADILLPDPLPSRGRVDVAIVGMACILPDAPDLATFWTNVVTGKNAVREVSPERWNPELYFDPEGTGEKTPSKWGGFIPDIVFDPGAYGIPPRSLAAIDPVQILALEVARRALEDAGLSGAQARWFDRERASVVFGTESGNDLSSAYGFRASYPQYLGEMPKELDASLPKLTEDSFPGVLSNVISGRIANRLDLRGSNYTVDAACASSLAALDVACKELAGGTSDLVIAGGADLHNGIQDYLMFASVHALSKTGQCRPFDGAADGIALGEGVAALVLKRLSDAERDGDKIYAVIKGVGSSSDGKSLGLTAPRKEGQLRALERAYARAGMSPTRVGLVEAHGTGTVVGDRTELAALSEMFTAAGSPAGRCTLGSVKSQIGHTKCTAGMAGLIKAALSIYHGVLPPTKNITSPNPGYDAESSPFVLREAAAPWSDDELVAGVSAFGFGGTNFHTVLSSDGATLPPATALTEWPSELFVLRGEGADDVARLVDALDAIAQTDVPPKLRDLALSAARENAGQPVKCALVAASMADLRDKLAAVREGRSVEGVFTAIAGAAHATDGKVAFLFPGQGSQRPGMLADLFVTFPQIRDLLELGRSYEDKLFPGGAYKPETRKAQQQAITDTRVAQPALGIADLAMARLLERVGVKPAMTAGHSYGELVALAAAGAFSADTLLALSEARAQSILGATGDEPGTMAAVRGSVAKVREVLGDVADPVVANHNAPDQAVIAGSKAAVEAACERLAAAGLSARPIPVACAFHSPIVAGAAEAFAEHLAMVDIEEPNIPVFANATAQPYAPTAEDVRETLAAQIGLPVRFVEEIEAMYAAGARVFVEAGPGNVLTDLVGRILRDRPHLAIACDRSGTHGVTALLTALGRLVAAGVDVDLAPLFQDRASAVKLSDLSSFAAPPTAWLVDGGRARPLRGELPEFAMRPLAAPLGLTDITAVSGESRTFEGAPMSMKEDESQSVVREYLRAMRELVDAQREVMLRFLGSPAQSEARAPVRYESQPPRHAQAPQAPKSAPSVHGSNGASSNGVHANGAYANGSNGTHANGAYTNGAHTNGAHTNGAHTNGAHTNGAHANGSNGVHVNGHAVNGSNGAAKAPARKSAFEVLVATVSERTGYPADMLDADLDLEADLGIDSIKRIEILGEMREKLGIHGSADAGDALVERLASAKTLRTIAKLLEPDGGDLAAAPAAAPVAVAAPAPVAPPTSTVPPASAAAPASTNAMPPPPMDLPAPDPKVIPTAPPPTIRAGGVPSKGEEAPARESSPPPSSVKRYVMELATVPPPSLSGGLKLSGKRFAITADAVGVAPKLVERLEANGAEARIVAPGDEMGEVDGLLHLASLGDGSPETLRRLFVRSKEATRTHLQWVLAATGHGGRFGHHAHVKSSSFTATGVSGFLKSLAKECPATRVRAIDLDPREDNARLAEHIFDEILADDDHIEVGYTAGERKTVVVAARPSSQNLQEPLEIDEDTVVLFTGGARGITAQIALAMARRFKCKIELVGRSSLLPEDQDDAELRTATDLASLRRLVIGRMNGAGPTNPQAIDAHCREILADREIRATLAAIREAGSPVDYHAIDVRDEAAFQALIDRLRARYGRIDGVVHGAGTIEDKLLRDKTQESFARVFSTKVNGARILARKLAAELRFFVLFSSVSGAFGNRGQIDYAAANDALDKLAHHLHATVRGRVLSINWGPWRGAGMVKPELEREYERRGIALIDPEAGVERFFEELLEGTEPQVILTAAPAEVLA
ncbi:SDR family NAD(P)-dependent oxidoreductase [Pendulispora albinea]|uniref:SDR family NAD(P)-dependent oxidoreductase n=1 Tax=Pendulispora albinea TaxID=2741071 RepID=A0ABZ2M8C5_9BACT